MTIITDLTEAEKDQLRLLYSVHRNPTITGTWKHELCRSLVEKHLAEEGPANPFPLVKITARGIEIAEQLAAAPTSTAGTNQYRAGDL